MNIRVDSDTQENSVTLTLEGDLIVGHQEDLSELVQLTEFIMRKMPRPERIVFDLSAVRRIDSAGVGALLRLHMTLKRNSVHLRLRGVRRDVQRALSISRIDSVLDIE
ncbi:STAS domain-containing protein [Candidatus Sumerlaeota bacterium]|nr:STAS domain-containing protein [Candidatus Sumerlaeota bacterium]